MGGWPVRGRLKLDACPVPGGALRLLAGLGCYGSFRLGRALGLGLGFGLAQALGLGLRLGLG
jgi:hypothetical protein